MAVVLSCATSSVSTDSTRVKEIAGIHAGERHAPVPRHRRIVPLPPAARRTLFAEHVHAVTPHEYQPARRQVVGTGVEVDLGHAEFRLDRTGPKRLALDHQGGVHPIALAVPTVQTRRAVGAAADPDAAVAHAQPAQPVRVHPDRRQRRPHAFLAIPPGKCFPHPVECAAQTVHEPVRPAHVVLRLVRRHPESLLEAEDGGDRCHVPCRLATHAVGHDEQPPAAKTNVESRILLLSSRPPESERRRHRRP